MNDRIRQAVRHFWATRSTQSKSQKKAGRTDAGARGAVTGGKQMDGFVKLIREVLIETGCPEFSLHLDRRIELPGWFRAEKQWDLVVVHEKQLVAAVEVKSQVGPSFGNNFNNRTEEALGSATDIWSAYREGAFKPSPRPWLGYLMVLEGCSGSSSPVKVCEPHFKVFPEFVGASYAKRYEILTRKLLRDRLYDGACFIVSPTDGNGRGDYAEPDPELGFDRLIRGITAHVAAACK